jgi:nitrite reductase/ring-hydroxylating ferredoxin subunit
MSVSNLRFFFIFALILFFASSCERAKYDVIPDVYVDFYVDLQSDIYFFDFVSAIGNSIYVSAETNNWGPKSAGYDGNGIILFHAQPEEYNAYDRTCPHCYANESLSIAVNIDGIIAVCPQCSTNYFLSSFGQPFSGPSQYPLKNYHTGIFSQYLHVWNK